MKNQNLEQKLIHEIENTIGRILSENEEEVVKVASDILINSNLIKG